MEITINQVQEIVSALTADEQQLLKDTINYGSWGDSDWEFLMIHPHNENYILALNSWTQSGDKLYIPNILKEEYYVGKYDSCFVAQERIRQYEKQIKRLQERIKQL